MGLPLRRAGLVFQEAVTIQVGPILQPVEHSTSRLQKLACALLVACDEMIAPEEDQVRTGGRIVPVVVQPGGDAESSQGVMTHLLRDTPRLLIVEVVVLAAYVAGQQPQRSLGQVGRLHQALTGDCERVPPKKGAVQGQTRSGN